MSIIKLQSSDGVIFGTDVQIAKCFAALETMIEHCMEGDGNAKPVVVAQVNSATLRKILEWAEYHKDDPTPAEDDDVNEKCTDDISEWDKKFLNVDKKSLLELINAANFLGITELWNIACKTVANMIKQKSPEEIRETFGIENDLDEE